MKEPHDVAGRVDDVRRIDFIKDIFSRIAGRYDFLNHVLSLRQDVAWRRFAARRVSFFKSRRFLDIASGTGDLAIETAVHHPEGRVIAVDFSRAMLDRARKKIAEKGLSDRIYLIRGNAMRLPFPQNVFDAAGMAFGIRNIPDKLNALKEMKRIVAPGGQVLILELSLPLMGWFRRVYDLYLNRLLPRIAAVYSPHPAAYRYLAHTVMNFPSEKDFVRIMRNAGWVDIRTYALTLGICRLFVGRKPKTG